MSPITSPTVQPTRSRTVAGCLAALVATWWLEGRPEYVVLDRNDAPMGILTLRIPEGHNRYRLPCFPDMEGALRFDAAFPDQAPHFWMPIVDIEEVRGIPGAVRLVSSCDGASLDDCEYFWPFLDPLPDPHFLATICSLQIRQEVAKLAARLWKAATA